MNESFFWVFDELVDLFLKTSLNDLFIDSVIQWSSCRSLLEGNISRKQLKCILLTQSNHTDKKRMLNMVICIQES